jgi:hypothetical protein
MVKTFKGVRAQWSAEYLKLAVSAVKSGTPLAAAFRIHGILHGNYVTGLVDRNCL